MTKAELESKHISELHALAAEAGVPRYRMLNRDELIEKLASGGGAQEKPRSQPRRESSKQQQQRRRSRAGGSGESRGRPQRRERTEQRPKAESPAPPERGERSSSASEEARRPRRRRRRRFGRRRKELTLRDTLLPGEPGGHAIAYAETKESCTAMLREFASELKDVSNAPDPVILLVDPGPEELADWRRAAPQAEIVAAAQARHAEDAIAQAVKRAESGESVIVLIDSLTRFGEAFKNTDAARDLLGAGRAIDSLTVVAALERR